MLTVIVPTFIRQLGIRQFPLKGEVYCDPIVRHYRGNRHASDLLADNIIIRTSTVMFWAQQLLGKQDHEEIDALFFTNMYLVSQDLESMGLNIVPNSTVEYRGNAAEFIRELESIPKPQSDAKAICVKSSMAYFWPKSLYDALRDAGYKVILEELGESHISHLFAFFTWCSFVGIDTGMFVVLSARYNAHPNLDVRSVDAQNNDLDMIGMGATVINYPASFWHYQLNLLKERPLEVHWDYSVKHEKNCLFLNRQPRPHRLFALSYFQQKGLLDQIYWSMIMPDNVRENNFEEYLGSLIEGTQRPRHHFNNAPSWINEQSLLDLKTIVPKTLDTVPEGRLGAVDGYYIENTDFSLVSETIGGRLSIYDMSTNEFPAFSPWIVDYYTNPDFRNAHRRYGFITEKTFKPISLGHPFLVIGNNKLLMMLQSMGFKTFDFAGFDESYDLDTDDHRRLERVLDEAIRLSREGFNAELAKDIVEHNKQVFNNQKHLTSVFKKWLAEPLIKACSSKRKNLKNSHKGVSPLTN